MELIRYVGGVLLPYLAVLTFLGGMVYRFQVWRKLASPAMTLFPAPATDADRTWNTIQEAVFFKSLLRGDRLLWSFAWAFHVILALILVGHLRVFVNADALLLKLGMSAQGIQAMSSSVGGAAGAVIVATAMFLLLRRLVIPRVREITNLADLLVLLLIGAVIITGDVMRFSEHFDLKLTRNYFAALASFGPSTAAPVLQNNIFLVHMILALTLIMLMPFSKLVHFGGLFFTHQLIRKH